MNATAILSIRRWLASCVLLSALLSNTSAFALDRERTLAQLHHTAWAAEDGAPGAVSALAQTTDGYLWLGTSSGLFRFDGVRFERFEAATGLRLPSSNISALQAMADGSLWIGYRFGGASLFGNAAVTHHTEREGFPPGSAVGFAMDLDGVVWAAANGALGRLQNGTWQQTSAEQWGYGGFSASRPLVDREGNLWVSAQEGTFFLPRGASRFLKVSSELQSADLALAPDGRVWASDSDPLRFGPLPRPTDAAPAAPDWHAFPNAADRPMFDRDGTVWIGTTTGLRRSTRPEALRQPAGQAGADAYDGYTQAQGLTGDFVYCTLEDREGNVWVGTSGGLDRFRNNKLERIDLKGSVGNIAAVAGDDGIVWAVTGHHELRRIGSQVDVLPDIPMDVTVMHRDPRGVIWIGGYGLWRLQDSKPVEVPLPEGIDQQNVVQAITSDPSGGLWMSIVRSGVYRLQNGIWMPFPVMEDLPELTAVTMTTDAAGRVWFGYTENRIAMFDGTRVHRYSAANGIQLGTVLALQARGGHLWAGGESGLALFDGERGFRSLTVREEGTLAGISGIVETTAGDLWLNGSAGIIHLAAAELGEALKNPSHVLHGRRFDFRDGLPGRPRQIRPLPTAIEGSDARLWFVLENGIVTLRPEQIARNPLPPPVLIESIHADEQRYAATDGLELPQLTNGVQIQYTATSLAIPDRVRFRYRLDGVDADWQDAGARREAFYTNLQPGEYRFQVIASNDDGVWNEQGATLAFSIPPTFFQTGLFRALCVVAGLALLWLLYLLRLRQQAARLRSLLEERHGERERIARELHDTLLQGIQGLILRFQAAAQQLPQHEPVRAAMEKALDRADDVLVEGRDRVRELRAAAAATGDLEEAFSRAAEEFALDRASAEPPAFRVQVEGRPRPLDVRVHDEVCRIGREALANAFRHSQASHIMITLTYDHQEFRLLVGDDGIGIQAEVLEAGGRDGHWGLTGMRERARQSGGRLYIRAHRGSGTQVELRIPAAAAYRSADGSKKRKPR